MDIPEDSVPCTEETEIVETMQYSDSEDKKKSSLNSSSEGDDYESASLKRVKRVRFSDEVDYCNFDTETIGNDMNTLPEELLNEMPSEEFRVEELTSRISELKISPISEEEVITEKVSPTPSDLNSHELFEPLDTAMHQDKEVMFEKEEEEDKDYSLSNVKNQRTGTMLQPKQTKRLNDLLSTDLSNKKAKDFKTAVYHAWTAVKKETKKSLPKFVPNKPEDEREQKTVRRAYLLWKKSKDKESKCAKKIEDTNLLSSNVSQESTKTGKEDSEMAFISWKKKKDELLKQETEKRIQRERSASEIAFMNKEEKRKDGESAFLAWKAHKEQLSREEKKKMTFYKEKEKQATEEKEIRDMEALNMYNLWVKSKSGHAQRNWSKPTLRPPWYPNGTK